MKKHFVKIAFVAVFAAIAGYGVYTSQKTETLSDLAMANVEALAQGEGGTVTIPCTPEDESRCTYPLQDAAGNSYNGYSDNMKHI